MLMGKDLINLAFFFCCCFIKDINWNACVFGVCGDEHVGTRTLRYFGFDAARVLAQLPNVIAENSTH